MLLPCSQETTKAPSKFLFFIIEAEILPTG
uniref:Uncharacterized protein n=1 Tax=Arundo donax TaxID=35708 RepID=A0A0A9H6S5_ARUDO